jgi:hypothetical protein
MEQLIVVALVIVASLVHGWIQRRQEPDDENDEQDPQTNRPRRPGAGAETGPGAPPRPQRPKPAGGGWEEELRRLLQGEEPAPRPKPSPPPPPPPPVASPAPPPMPKTARPAAPAPFLTRSNIPVPAEGTEMEVGLPVRPVVLSQAGWAHDRAQIHASVVQRMQDTASRVTSHVTVLRDRPNLPPPAGATIMRDFLRHREGQRAGIVASIVLGPPRSLDPAR